jgi:putative glutamine amidotransferase
MQTPLDAAGQHPLGGGKAAAGIVHDRMSPPRPLIGLVGRRKRGADVAGLPPILAGIDVDVYVNDYARAITEAGGLPVYLPLHIEPAEYAGRLDGLLLTGGTDVDPAHYGASPEPETFEPEPTRDLLELGLVDLASEEHLPVLGICRGLQLLNVWAGGTLNQHVPAHARYDVAPDEHIDQLSIEPGTVLHALYGSRLGVNSLHHQTVDRVADGWTVAARSGDGDIEALEWPGHDVIAVQWHPELLGSRASDPLFAWLVDRAARLTRPREPAPS